MTLTETEKETIQREVKDQFDRLITAINQMNLDVWSAFYSRDGFISAIAGTDRYGIRSAWVEIVTRYFSTRKCQLVEPTDVQVIALAADLALLTSAEKSEMLLQEGETMNSRHVFTMLWKREPEGWKILHSHESWKAE